VGYSLGITEYKQGGLNMSDMCKVIILFVTCIISFVLSQIMHKIDEWSPLVVVFLATGLATFATGLIMFLLI
jgi:hypothetical protein